jgi:hypothetical protein
MQRRVSKQTTVCLLTRLCAADPVVPHGGVFLIVVVVNGTTSGSAGILPAQSANPVVQLSEGEPSWWSFSVIPRLDWGIRLGLYVRRLERFVSYQTDHSLSYCAGNEVLVGAVLGAFDIK